MATACLSSELADIDQVLTRTAVTAIDFVEYRLMLCSRAMTHAKSLTCYGYKKATRILRLSQRCRTLVTRYNILCFYKLSLIAIESIAS